jgi:hypothetical protein
LLRTPFRSVTFNLVAISIFVSTPLSTRASAVLVEPTCIKDFREVGTFRSLESWDPKDEMRLYDLTDDEIARVHAHMMSSNIDYAREAGVNSSLKISEEILEKGTLNGRPRDRADAFYHVRHAISQISTKLKLNPFAQIRTTEVASLVSAGGSRSISNEISSESAAILNRGKYAASMKSWDPKDGMRLYELTDDEIARVHAYMMSSNINYAREAGVNPSLKISAEILETGKLNGRPRDRADAFSHVRDAISQISTKLKLNPFQSDPTFEIIGKMSTDNSPFSKWAQFHVTSKDWDSSPETASVAAKKLLSDWDAEVTRRYTPVVAQPHTTFVNPQFEKIATQATIGDIRYVASADGKYWVAISSQAKIEHSLVPRWNGSSDAFAEALREVSSPSWKAKSQELAKAYQREAASSWKSGVSPPLSETAPTIPQHEMKVYRDGKLVPSSSINTIDLRQKFINAGAWGYHVMPRRALVGIEREGWIPNLVQTGESAGSPGLHLSTHLGVEFPVDGPVAILRVPMNANEYHPMLHTSYHGHVVRDHAMSSEQVHAQAEFSVDGGVTWFPMLREFTDAAQIGLLPTGREIPNPASRP